MADKTYADLTAATDMQDADLLASWRPSGPGPLKKIQASVAKDYMLAALGTASTADTGTSGHVIPYLDGENTWSADQMVGDQPSGDSSGVAANTRFVAAAVAALASRGYIDGLTLSTAGASSTFGVSAGVGVDSTNEAALALASAFTKTTGSWAVGTGNGALLTGSIANGTWYHAFLIQRPDSGLVDIGLDTVMDPTAHLPTNYTLFRYIGSMLTDGSAHWVKFSQRGDQFLWDAASAGSTQTIGTSAVLVALDVPTGVSVTAIFNALLQNGSATCSALFTSPDQAVQAANSPNGNEQLFCPISGGDAAQLQIRTNTSAQVRCVTSSATSAVAVNAQGWIDPRGRNA